MSDSEHRRDAFQLSRDWLSVQEVVDAVGSASCGAISVFIGLYWIYRSAFVWKTMWKRLLQLYVASRRYNPWGWARRQEGDRSGVRSLRAHGPVRVHQAVCWHQSALANRGAHLCASPTGVWCSVLLLTGASRRLFTVFILSRCATTHQIYKLVLQVGGGGSGQRCHGNLVSTSPRQPAGNPALHQPAEGKDSHMEEGTNPEVWSSIAVPSAAKHHRFCINRKFMTHRTAAGRRTLNVHGQLTANSPRKRLPQRTCECAGKDGLWRKIMVSLELMLIYLYNHWKIKTLILMFLRGWDYLTMRSPFYLNSYNHYIPNKQTAGTFQFFLH